MKLQNKSLLILLSTFIPLLLVFYFGARFFILDHHQQLEIRIIHQNIARVRNAINQQIETIDNVLFDWAAWDEMYAFAFDDNTDFREANLIEESFTALQLNLLAIVNSTGTVLEASAYDLQRNKAAVFPNDLQHLLKPQTRLTRHIKTDSSVNGLMMINGEPAIIATRPILTSRNEGPIRGTLLMGRYLTSDVINHISRNTQVPLSLYPLSYLRFPPAEQEALKALYASLHANPANPAPIYSQPEGNEMLAGYTLLRNINGVPILMLRAELPRDIYRGGLAALNQFALYLLCLGLLFALLILWLFEHFILARLIRLVKDIGHIREARDPSLRVSRTSNDELGGLEDSLNVMLTSLEQAGHDLQASEEKYRLFVQRFQGIAFRCNIDFSPVFLHGAVEDITGYTEQDLLAEKPRWADLVHPDDQERIAACAEQLRLQPDFSYEREYRIIRKDGTLRWIRERIRNICDEHQTPRFVQGTVFDITARIQAEEELRLSRQQLQHLSSHLQSIREEERARIARHIHDDLGQMLMVLNINVDYILRHISQDNEPLKQRVEEMVTHIQQIVEIIQKLAIEMKPSVIETLGPSDAIEWQVRQFREQTGINCEAFINLDSIHLKQECATALYRIVQEALTNIGRHAHAKNVNISLAADQQGLNLIIRDDGSGIDSAVLNSPQSFGLNQIRERAAFCHGQVRFESPNTGGTVIRVLIPVDYLMHCCIDSAPAANVEKESSND